MSTETTYKCDQCGTAYKPDTTGKQKHDAVSTRWLNLSIRGYAYRTTSVDCDVLLCSLDCLNRELASRAQIPPCAFLEEERAKAKEALTAEAEAATKALEKRVWDAEQVKRDIENELRVRKDVKRFAEDFLSEIREVVRTTRFNVGVDPAAGAPFGHVSMTSREEDHVDSSALSRWPWPLADNMKQVSCIACAGSGFTAPEFTRRFLGLLHGAKNVVKELRAKTTSMNRLDSFVAALAEAIVEFEGR